MTRLESCPGCGDDLDVPDVPDAVVRCGFCGTTSKLDVDADLGSDGQYVDRSALVIVGVDPGTWLVAWRQLINQTCHAAVNDFTAGGRDAWDRGMAARDELIDLLFESINGVRLSAALVTSPNLSAVPAESQIDPTIPIWRRRGGFDAHRDGLD